MVLIATDQTSTLPPAQPNYILRGHSAQIHAVQFLRRNLRLLTGDAEGWVVLWDVPIKRPVAVWKAHTATVLGLGCWGDERVITHGRDGKLHIWQLREQDEADLSRTLPIEDAITERKQPWLLHTLVVNTINFCSFASCTTLSTRSPSTSEDDNPDEERTEVLLIATSGLQDGSINITRFPGEDRVATIPAPKDTNTGMLMAVGLHCCQDESSKPTLAVFAGYESGQVALFTANTLSKTWNLVYICKPHAQPVLSISSVPSQSVFLTSGADAVIARHPLPSTAHTHLDTTTPEILQTKHAGQQSITARSDGKIFATAGWDGRARVYSAGSKGKGMRELAVLKWHREGCYAVAFAEILDGVAEAVVSGKDGEVVKRELTVAERRVQRASQGHWLAVGSKDGKVSLWEIY